MQFAHQLVERINRNVLDTVSPEDRLNKVFYSDAGDRRRGRVQDGSGLLVPQRLTREEQVIGLEGAYHGDTTGTMSVGYSDLFHKPFVSWCL